MGGDGSSRQGERRGDFLAGKYLLEDCLGIGGMGEVYRATNVSLGRKVAIKVLSHEYVHIEDDVLRFLREARAAAAVRHPNVVDVLDVARDDDGTPFIVQELLAGEDLERYLRTRHGCLSFEEALEIMIPVADAVAAAHAQDVVHRDLKPANIFLARDRNKITPKVLDFGACLFPTIAERSAKEIKMLIGTPHYMAPEQIVSKKDVDARSDVWALGVILYEMLVGETPFEADSLNAVLQLVKTRDVPSVLERVKDAPLELDVLIARCTKRDRLARYRNAGELHADMIAVRQSVRGAPASSRRPTIAERSDAPLPPRTQRAGLLTLSSPTSEPPPSSEFDLDIVMPASRPKLLSEAPSARESERRQPSSLPPVLDPRSAGVPSAPPSAPVQRELELADAPPRSRPVPSQPSLPPLSRASHPSLPPAIARPVGSQPSLPPYVPSPTPSAPVVMPSTRPRPPAPSQSQLQESASARRRTARAADTAKLVGAAVAPAVLGAVLVRVVPALGGPLGGALRGDSTLASGAMAVAALVGAAVLGARTLLGGRKSRTLYLAAAGGVLFGIVMIIVTFAASEAAQLGISASMGGLSSIVAPIAPLALAIDAIVEARASLAEYERGDARRFAALASLFFFLALALSPIGAVRVKGSAPQAHHDAG